MSNKLKKIISVTTSVTTIAWVSGIAMLAPMAASAIVGTIAEGDTIRVANTLDIYIAKYVGAKAFKRLILSPSVFNSYGHLSWGAVKTVTQAEMDQFTTSELVRAENDAKVYQLTPVANSDSGAKHWLNMTAEQFTASGRDWDSIYMINGVDRDSYAASTDITDGTIPPVAGALSVALASDTPAAGIAPESAARVPFTKVNLTAGSNEVTISSLTIQRTGLADDAALSSVMLVDASDNSQIGLNQVLNASHQVTITEAIKVPANSTKSIILSANMPASLDSYAGQVAALSLVAVNTTATVSGSLPLTGNGQTINGTLSIGSATVNRGSLDPGADSASKEVGTTEYKFTGLKITAGAAEDMSVESIRFNQSGSAASSDLANVKVSDGTTDYATTVSADGKYYKVIFPSGIVIAKGLNKEFTIKGDIIGGSVRTISFDVYRDTDIVIKGTTFGYYRTVDGTSEQTTPTDGQFGTGTPFFNAYDVTVGTGTLRVDKSASGAPATNITEGATGQILGAFDFVVKGEAVNVASIVVDFDHVGVGSTSDITNITLAKEDGSVLAGPVNGADETTSHAATLDGTRDGYATFSGTVTFAVGTTKILVKGNLNTDFDSNNTFRVGFDPPSTRVSSITGGTTGNSITAAPTTEVYGNTMTVKSGSLTVSVSGTPVAQTVIRGISGFTFANYVFDASASGEDIRINSIALQQIVDAAANDNAVSGMQLWDGTTALNTGTNVQDPDGGLTTNAYTFTLDTPLIISKATSKTIALKGNLSGSATAGGTQKWGLIAGAAVAATGVSTGNDIGETITAADGQTMTIAAGGQYSVALDSSTPAGKLIAGGTTGNIMTVLKFKATAEAINVSKMRLFLRNASSTGIDLANVTVWDGATQLSSGAFGNYPGGASGTGNTASTTFTLSPVLQIPANGEKLVTIKADIGAIATYDTTATAGHQISIDYLASADTSYNLGTGQSSGSAIASYSPNTAQTAAYIFKSVPTVATVALPTTTLTSGTVTLNKFKVTADAKGDIDVLKFTFKIATTSQTTGASLTLSNLTLVDVTSDAEVTLYASTTAFVAAGGTLAEIFTLASPGTWGTSATTSRTVSAGTSRTFELRGDVANAGSGASISTQLEGDSAQVATTGGNMWAARSVTATNAVENDNNNDFIWSDKSDASHSATDFTIADWTNGYLVSGLPSSNLAAQIVSR